MKSIYQDADEVLVWLGDFDQLQRGTGLLPGPESLVRDSVKVLKFLAGLTKIQMMDWGIDMRFQSLFQDTASNDSTCIKQEVWASLKRLFASSWFERLWIIQEVAASKSTLIVWEGEEIPWKVIQDAARYILNPWNIPPNEEILELLPRMGVHRVGQVTLTSTNPDNILTALHNTQDAKCTDPRDRLYAILGVVKDTEDVIVDYSKPVQEVYRQWAENRIRRTNSLDILDACADSANKADLPSWVPDLRKPWGQDKILWSQACGSSTPKFQWDIEFLSHGRKLNVRGTKFNSITSLSEIGDAISNITRTTLIRERLYGIITSWEKWAFDNIHLPTDSKRRLFNLAILRAESRSAVNLLRQFELYISHMSGKDGVSISARELADMEKELFPRLHGCQIFVTTTSGIGAVAGNCGARSGDELWLLDGARSPLILRPEPGGYRVIGPCYTLSDTNSCYSPMKGLITLQ